MRTIKNMMVVAATACLALSSCVEDTIYNTEHPAQARITLTADWSDRTSGVAAPAAYTARVGEHSALLAGDKPAAFPNLLNPGIHRLQAYNTAEKITVEGNTASVAVTDGFADPMPGWFFTASQDVSVEQDRDYDITAVMHQRVRELTLGMTLGGGSADKIASITGVLSGVAQSLGLDDGVPTGDAVKVSLTFAKQEGGKWSASVRLLGVTGAQQKLTTTIVYTPDSGIGDQAVDIDLTDDLEDFGDGGIPTVDIEEPIISPYAITMTNDGNGSAVADPANATPGQEVTITATPTAPANFKFKQWAAVGGSLPAFTEGNATTSPAKFTMPEGAVSIKAEFTMMPDAVAQATTLVHNTTESTGANTVYTFTLPVAAPGAAIATATVTCNGGNVASSLTGAGNVHLAFTDAVLAALPYDKNLTVTYTVTYGGQTSTAVTTHTIPATELAALTDIITIRKAAANAEAAKITGFTAGTNDSQSLVFNITGYGSLTPGTTLALVETKAGASSGGAVDADLGAGISTFAWFGTQKTVDAADLTYVGVTFTATLNGTTSDPKTLDVSALFGATTTAGKLRTDKAKFAGNYSVTGWNRTPGSRPLTSQNNTITLSAGVSISATNFTCLSGGTGALGKQSEFSISATDGGQIMITTTFAPTGVGSATVTFSLSCNGTGYTFSELTMNMDQY